jgi:hypothetical protein
MIMCTTLTYLAFVLSAFSLALVNQIAGLANNAP